MTDKQLLSCAKAFRKEIVGKKNSANFCFMVCAPLEGYLGACGIKTTLIEGMVQQINHFWLQLPDGRVLDPTADQFNDENLPLPPVYLGPPLKIHEHITARGKRIA